MAVGKLVRGAMYFHRDVVADVATTLQSKCENAAAMTATATWNVARVHGSIVGLLQYEEFDTEAFPSLLFSTRVDLTTGLCRQTDFRGSANPLILHRKELLVAANDPRAVRWARVTRMLEDMGLFRDNKSIGRRKAWSEKLARVGLKVLGDEVVPL